MPSAAILLADGTEEMESTITYNTLVHTGVTCYSAFVPAANVSVERPYATRLRGIHIMYDAALETQSSSSCSYNALLIPGGAKGTETMSTNLIVQNLVRDFLTQDKITGMICAGGQAALTANLPRQPLTSHPSVKAQLENAHVLLSFRAQIHHAHDTPGTAFPFTLALVELLCSADKRAEVCAPMVYPPNTPF
ncbi:class I glutamine amidotransferase-like protein [Mycena olivaceomarginata]|nr:class I glutamine amidotransferase-like protein [Mycena olivaceomarginata]